MCFPRWRRLTCHMAADGPCRSRISATLAPLMLGQGYLD
jgi:hypothetical protein